MSETYPGIKASMGEKDGKIIYYMIKMRVRILQTKWKQVKP